MALIKVRPFVSQIDQIVRISATGLSEKQRVTLRSKLTGDKGERLESFAHYIADEQGRVCVSSQPAVGGSYAGVEPMGLLWSMKPSPGQRDGIRLLKKDVTKPYIVNIDVFDGHLHLEGERESVGAEPLTSATFEKSYMKAGLRRIPVREGRLRGTLFLPPGDGPFPGIVEFFGGGGNLTEIKGSLLASHGFATFSLAFFGYDDLPKLADDYDCGYFEDAAIWLSGRPEVSQGGIAAMSVSGGTQFLFTLAVHRQDLIKAVVAVSPLLCFFWDCFYKERFYPGIRCDLKMPSKNDQGHVVFKDVLLNGVPENRESPAIIPVEEVSCPILLVYGTDDLCFPAEYNVERIVERLREHGKEDQCTAIGYPGAGHLIEPPYLPLCDHSMIRILTNRVVHAWGGETKQHAIAQEDSWLKILNFLQQHHR